jgi:hypothetical protein
VYVRFYTEVLTKTAFLDEFTGQFEPKALEYALAHHVDCKIGLPRHASLPELGCLLAVDIRNQPTALLPIFTETEVVTV